MEENTGVWMFLGDGRGPNNNGWHIVQMWIYTENGWKKIQKKIYTTLDKAASWQ